MNNWRKADSKTPTVNMETDSPRYSPAPKNATIAVATDLREDQLRLTEESVQHQLAQGTKMSIRPPPALNISGRVLVATFLLPFQGAIDLEEGQVWDITPRRGNSALYSSIRYLGEDTDFDTKLIGWTGEIQPKFRRPWERKRPTSPKNLVNGVANGQIDDIEDGKVANDVAYDDPSNYLVALTKADKKSYEDELKKRQPTVGKKYELVPIWTLEDADGQPKGKVAESVETQSRFRKYPEQVLWPLLHYVLWTETDGRQEIMWWQDYVKLNQKFAQKIIEIYQPGDIIWIHDYFLALLPEMIKKEIPNAYIGMFMHAPFPSSEYFRCLPKRKEVLTGMLGASMIGFQNYSYSRHFVSSCIRVLGFESTKNGVDAHGARVAIEAFPIGIDVTRVEKELANPSTLSQMTAIREIYAGKKIIVGRDRLDEVRGVLQKLRVFEMLLDQYPEWRGRVVLIQVTSEAQHHALKLEKKVADLVSFINGKYGSLEFTPVHHYHHQLEPDQYFALLRVADLGLITSVRDGMNTMGLEYVVCQKDHNGPVILSEFTGTAGSLTDALHVNPWDTAGVAKAINYALCMSPEDREVRQRHLYQHVTTHTVQAWTTLFLKRLMENLNSCEQSQTTPQLDENLLSNRFETSRKRLLMFDYDGTLTPIVKEPSAAVPTEKLLRTLKALTVDPKNTVWIISGRDQVFLDKHLGDIPGLGLSAEHGCFLKKPHAAKSEWINLTVNMDMSWQKDVLDIFEYYTERTIGSKVERKRCALTWHYRNADPEFGLWQCRELQTHLEQAIIPKHAVEILTGKANLEVRPRDINKGEIVGRLVHEHIEDLDFVFCAGDDKTDEDMFRQLRKTNELHPEVLFPTTVGAASKMTSAKWHVLEPMDIVNTMARLAGTENESSRI